MAATSYPLLLGANSRSGERGAGTQRISRSRGFPSERASDTRENRGQPRLWCPLIPWAPLNYATISGFDAPLTVANGMDSPIDSSATSGNVLKPQAAS